MLVLKTWKSASAAPGQAARLLLAGWGRWLISISHRSMAVCGLVVVLGLMFIAGRADVRQNLESWTLDWLRSRQEVLEPMPLTAEAEEAIAAKDASAPASPTRLDRAQKAVAHWIAKRYRVAPEPIGSLVKEAWALGQQAKLEPTLILAIMAVESSFNPFAQSPVGAQGLMQVMTSVHDDKYQPFGGTQAAFDPLTNLRVGVLVLKECVQRAGGSLEGGLRLYVGAANLEDDGGYAARVLAEQDFMRQVADGRAVPVTAKWTPPASGVIASALQIFSLPTQTAVSLPLPPAPVVAVVAPPPAQAVASSAAIPTPPLQPTTVHNPAAAQPALAPVPTPVPVPISVAPATTAPKAPSITEAASVPPSPHVKSQDDKAVPERVALLQ